MNFKFPIVLLLILMSPVVGNTYDNTKVHRAINENALSQSNVDTYLKNKLGFSKGIKEIFNSKRAEEWISEGGYQEDEPVTRTLNHFHDPTKAWDSAGLNDSITIFGFPILTFTGESSILWMQKSDQSAGGGTWSWPKARQCYYLGLTSDTKAKREQNLADTFKALGHIMHLVSDVSVPAHVRNDAHPGGDPYETYTEQKVGTLQYSGYETVTLPKLTDFWDDEQGKGLAEFTNSNFFSKDRNKDNAYYTNPKVLAEDEGFLQEVTDADGNKEIVEVKYGLGTVTDSYANASYANVKLTAYSLWDFEHEKKTNKRIYFLDDTIHQTYADFLIPRAVGYSTGLLNYFFRGDLDMIPDGESGSGYVIVNNTDEDMSGEFILLYDKQNGDRAEITRWTLSINKKDPNNSNANKSANITFTPPTDMKEENKYLLVFQGKLGNEEGAVAGKQVELGSRSIFLANISKDILPFNISVENSKYIIKPADSSLVTKIKSASINASSALLEISSTPDNYKHSIKVPPYPECYSTDINRYAAAFKSCIHDGITRKIRIGGPNTCRPKAIYAPNEPSEYGFYELLAMDSRTASGRNNFTFNQDKTMLISIDNFVKGKSIKDDYTYGTLPPYTATTTIARDYRIDYLIDNRNVSEDLLLTSNIIKWNQYGSYVSEDDGQGNTKSVFRRWNTEENVWNNIIAVLDENNAIYSKTTILSSSDWTITSESDNHSATSVENKSSNRPANYKLMMGSTVLESIDSEYKYTKHVNNTSEPNIQPVYVIAENTDNPTITYNVMSYDNKYGTDYAAVIYSIQTQKNNVKVDITYPPDNIDPNYKDTETTDIKNTYYLYYKINDSIKKLQLPAELSTINIQNIEGNVGYDSSGNPLGTGRLVNSSGVPSGLLHVTLQEESSTSEGSRITGISSQVNKTNIVYTYVIERYEDNEWKFDKRIIGIINVADGKLPVGYRQEFEITESNASGVLTGTYSSFNYKDPSAIGFHVEIK